jgi:hypothetical protein
MRGAAEGDGFGLAVKAGDSCPPERRVKIC